MAAHLTESGEKPTQERMTLTVEEAARALGIGRASAYLAVKTGELPTVRIGRRLLVPRHRLDALLGCETSESPAGLPDSREDTARTRRGDSD